ncbi:MAG: 50S ribosomal protein L17 [Planctomycetes bacterium]|nr:50S ribosomal protein L17 [Planctomycetota bacterium]
MRHAVAGYKLGRDGEDRRALRRNLAAALLTHGQITTTLPKAKSVQPFVERMITFAKRGTLAARRHVISELGDRIIVKNDQDDAVTRNRYGELVKGPRLIKKLFDEIAPVYADRPGGYTRIVKLAKHRIGDGSSLVLLMLVQKDETGPQVQGQHSRRRDKANKRMEFSAKLRKARSEKPAEPEKAAEAKAE